MNKSSKKGCRVYLDPEVTLVMTYAFCYGTRSRGRQKVYVISNLRFCALLSVLYDMIR